MNPYVISAQFAAYVWYEHQNPQKSNEEAVLFARRNWNSFLPCSHKGIGRLLAKMAEPRMSSFTQPASKRTGISRKMSPCESNKSR